MERQLGDPQNAHLTNHTLENHTIQRNPCWNGYNNAAIIACGMVVFWLLLDVLTYKEVPKFLSDNFGITSHCFSSTKFYCGNDMIQNWVIGLLALLGIVLTATHRHRSVLIRISSTATECTDREILLRCENVIKSTRAYEEMAIGAGLVLAFMYLFLEVVDKNTHILLVILLFAALFLIERIIHYKSMTGSTEFDEKVAKLIQFTNLTLIVIIMMFILWRVLGRTEDTPPLILLSLTVITYVVLLVLLLVLLLAPIFLQLKSGAKHIVRNGKFAIILSLVLIAFSFLCIGFWWFDISKIEYLLGAILLSTLFSFFIVPVIYNNRETSAICQCFTATRRQRLPKS